MTVTQERHEQMIIDMAMSQHPDWAHQIHLQGIATVEAILRERPFSWLPRGDILNWIRSLE